VQSLVDEQAEIELIKDMGRFSRDPEGFVLYAFPWGQGELAKYKAPEKWQLEILREVRDGLKTVNEVIQDAVASGNGIGKSALVAWLLLWAMSTCEDTRGVVTSNTETQLRTKTWPELAKWFRFCITRHWFELTDTSLYSRDPQHQKTWRIDRIAWSKTRPEAFAGLHNKGKRIIIVFDEASAIDDIIWETTEGALTDKDTEILWFAFGNPTRTNGRFHACFHTLGHRWKHHQIDSRTVKISNKDQIKKWVEDHGEDSDFVRVHVRGMFPLSSSLQFIPSELVEAARGKHLNESRYSFAAKVLALDNAWTGGDEIVIGLRQGLAYRQLAILKKNDDDMKIAQAMARYEDEEKADAVFIDLGYGTGVHSAGKQMNRNWQLVPFGGASNDPRYLNKRAEMWGLVKDWLKGGGIIPDDAVLCEDLTGPEGYEVMTGPNAGKIYLESKDDMKARGLRSPNRGDTLALTFAMPVQPKNRAHGGLASRLEMARTEYDVLAH
jgi:hypothetical protein